MSQNLCSLNIRQRGYSNTVGKLTDDELYDFIDVSMSVRQNLAMLREQGKKCKNERMCRLLNLKKENMSKLIV